LSARQGAPEAIRLSEDMDARDGPVMAHACRLGLEGSCLNGATGVQGRPMPTLAQDPEPRL
jgi:hypothetical protein